MIIKPKLKIITKSYIDYVQADMNHNSITNSGRDIIMVKQFAAAGFHVSE